MGTWRPWGADIAPALWEFCAGLLDVFALPEAGDEDVLVDEVLVVFVEEDVDGALLLAVGVDVEIGLLVDSGDDWLEGGVPRLLCDDDKSTERG